MPSEKRAEIAGRLREIFQKHGLSADFLRVSDITWAIKLGFYLDSGSDCFFDDDDLHFRGL